MNMLNPKLLAIYGALSMMSDDAFCRGSKFKVKQEKPHKKAKKLKRRKKGNHFNYN